ncbi:hypothetical protein C4K22_3744 [Pseudomonas chlororaphis subsp. aurantiaca]|nr:hypothetical protein C4K28_3622 [Pseudomonas chlororaphis subsp. piscium]AZD22851.1 hypothetical protein C4K24_3550 [Pseudomonas chlororaphis subsp. aurantiaca]AZD36485.1 hypothetical protein C4K22_3744 [Pseudomonas chlororaphis subsp. aurantiaca]AZD42823.1 hypothetical protein C4K21_3751 [Pseudomonas chlororaphis subsp. aurantiaca]AZD49056.1 hypothetical protein C4K20_3643 [Pseudomonas chlororaphis subsp. aurantiaca]
MPAEPSQRWTLAWAGRRVLDVAGRRTGIRLQLKPDFLINRLRI